MVSPIRLQRRGRVLSIRIVRSFYFAFAGLFFLFRTQRNARIELLIGLCAFAAAWWVGISRAEWGVLVLASCCVIILEGLNTAIEAAVDLASPQVHPLAKSAKDLAAGMVLVAAIGSVIVGVIILGPPMWERITQR